MPTTGSVPVKAFPCTCNTSIALEPTPSGSVFVKLFNWSPKKETARIARMPLSGSAPVNRFE
eukprot:4653341-Amphidinium_carterae.1